MSKLMKTLMLCVAFCTIQQTARATHAAGVDLTYSFLGGDSIELKLSFYRDCAGIPAPTSPVITIIEDGSTTNTLTLTQQTFYQSSPLAPSLWSLSSCNGGSMPGLEVYIYSGVYHLNPTVNVFKFSFTECCRNNAITNLLNPGGESMYVEAYLYAGILNTLNQHNNSPDFTTPPVPWTCIGQPFTYNHGTYDADGDSLVFTAQAPLNAPGGPVVYATGFSPTNPLAVDTSGFQFSTTTGQISFTPTTAQVVALSLMVQEYRNGALIGSTMRDMQVYVYHCDSNQNVIVQRAINMAPDPSVEYIPDPSNTGGVFRVAAHHSFQFTQRATDPDAGQVLTAISNVDNAIPGSSMTTYRGDHLFAQVNVAPMQTKQAYFTITFSDNALPMPSTGVVGYAVISENILGLESAAAPTIHLVTYPSPVTAGDMITAYIPESVNDGATLVLTDAMGRQLQQQVLPQHNGNTFVHINTEGLAVGQYTLQLVTAHGNAATKVMVIK